MSCCSLDWQRLPGQEARPVDVVVRLRREVDNLQVAVSRLEDRPPGERDSHWDVDAIRDWLHHQQDRLRAALARRERERVSSDWLHVHR